MSSQPGAVYWIDHYVVPTNDMLRWQSFMENVFGPPRRMFGGLTTAERLRRAPIRTFFVLGRYHQVGGFLQNEMLPSSSGLGKGLPRYGFFIRPEDVETHLRRLDEHQVPHTDPVRTSAEGEEGTVIYFEDPDGNQYEFWAPVDMPPGAMDSENPLGVGRISSVVQESRDLDRTAGFYERYCGLDVIRNYDVEKGVLSLRMGGGGRMIFHRVEELNPRTFGHNRWQGRHTALTVLNDEFSDAYQRLWADLPESEYVPYSADQIAADEASLPPRTELHGLQARGERANAFGRGTFFYDWDANDYHLMGGIPLDGGMANYRVGFDENFREVGFSPSKRTREAVEG